MLSLSRCRWVVASVVAALTLILTSCSSPHPVANIPPPPPQPYTRIARPDTNTVQLQIAVRKFVPVGRHGPVVWLAGTSHIGEPQYYQALQQHLDAQTLVLFEGVNSGAHKRHIREPAQTHANDAGTKSESDSSQAAAAPGIQSTLAQSLGLVFQLDAIDYDRTNFLNSDLSVQEIQRLMDGGKEARTAQPGATTHGNGQVAGNPSFQYLLEIMDGSSFLGSIMKLGMEFIGSNSKLQALTKLAMIEALGQLRGDITAMRGLPPDMQELIKVLIEARNQAVIDDLKLECRKIPRSGSIAIFYGTGHMDDMEKRLARELNYRPAGEIWLTAFAVDLHQSGLSPAESDAVRNLVKWEMDQLHP